MWVMALTYLYSKEVRNGPLRDQILGAECAEHLISLRHHLQLCAMMTVVPSFSIKASCFSGQPTRTN